MFEINGTSYLTTTEAAKLLDRSPATLRNQRNHQREIVSSIRIGGSVLYRLSEVQRAATSSRSR